MKFDYTAFRAAYVERYEREQRRAALRQDVQKIRAAAAAVPTAGSTSFQIALNRAQGVESERRVQALTWGLEYEVGGIGACCSVTERQALSHIESSMWKRVRRLDEALEIGELIDAVEEMLRSEHRSRMTLKQIRLEQQKVML